MPSTGEVIRGAPEVHLRLGQGRLALTHHRLRAADLRLHHAHLRLRRLEQFGGGAHQRLGAVGLDLGDEAACHQAALALEVALRLLGVHPGLGQRRLDRHLVGLRREHVGTGCLHVGLRLAHAMLEGLRVEAGDQLSGTDFGVEVDPELTHLARDLRAHRDLRHGVDGAAGRHRGRQRAALHLRRAPPGRLRLVAPEPPPAQGRSRQGGQHGDRQHPQPGTCAAVGPFGDGGHRYPRERASRQGAGRPAKGRSLSMRCGARPERSRKEVQSGRPTAPRRRQAHGRRRKAHAARPTSGTPSVGTPPRHPWRRWQAGRYSPR